MLRMMNEGNRLCKAVVHESSSLLPLSFIAIMLLASRVSVDVFKKLRGFCQQWIDSDKPVMRRTGLVGVLLLTQGRGQVVKGDLPRLW